VTLLFVPLMSNMFSLLWPC